MNKQYFIITLILSAAVMFFAAYQLLKQKHLMDNITYWQIFLNLFWLPTSLFYFVVQKLLFPGHDFNDIFILFIYINIAILFWVGLTMRKENKRILSSEVFEWVRGYKDDH